MDGELIFNIYWVVINLLAYAAFVGFICSGNDDPDLIKKYLEENNYDDDYIDTFLL